MFDTGGSGPYPYHDTVMEGGMTLTNTKQEVTDNVTFLSYNSTGMDTIKAEWLNNTNPSYGGCKYGYSLEHSIHNIYKICWHFLQCYIILRLMWLFLSMKNVNLVVFFTV